MAGIKYWNGASYGGWKDFEDYSTSIKKWDGTKWVDGTSNQSSKVFKWDGSKHIQLFPKTEAIATKTWESSSAKYTNNKHSGTTWTVDYARAGAWGVNDYYTGWLNIKGAGWLGGSINEIVDVKCNYVRQGVGNWEKGIKIPMCLSSLTDANVSWDVAHNSKGTTFYSDTEMLPCDLLDDFKIGWTTFNNDTAKTQIKHFMETGKSLLIGYNTSGGEYVSVSGFIEFSVTYKHPVTYALFDKEVAYKYNNIDYLIEDSGYIGVYLYEDEINKTLEEVIEDRINNNIPSVDVV